MSLFQPPTDVQHYAVGDGLIAGEYPGGFRREIALRRLQGLVDEGVTTFIDLTTPEDAARGLEPYDHLLAECRKEGGRELTHYRFAIPDMKVPESAEIMQGVTALIRQELAAGRMPYVHCWGGIGRTGTAVGCWLVENGADPEAALAKVQALYDTHMGADKRARHPRSPQAPSQFDYVRDWPRFLERHSASTPAPPPQASE